jgi:type III secretory pathway component EscT
MGSLEVFGRAGGEKIIVYKVYKVYKVCKVCKVCKEEKR